MTHSTCPPPRGGSSPGRTAALLGASAVASLFLAACGGDSDSPNPPPPPPAPITQVPTSAAASDMALEAFAFNLALSDTKEPLGLDNITTLPTSEVEEPIATP
jgi:hypothetical protein